MKRGIKRKFDELQLSDEKQLSLNTLDSGCMSVLQYLSYRERGMYPSAIHRQTRAYETAELLLAVVQGNEEKAKRLLEINPGLLRNEEMCEVTDYSGRRIGGLTPFQAALCGRDFPMCEMMREYFLKLKDGHAELTRQFDEIFPDGFEAADKAQQDNAFDFNPILKAISEASDEDVKLALNKQFDNKNSTLIQALNEFREQFSKVALSEILFNPYHALRAYEAYDTGYDNLKNPADSDDWSKRDLFWRQVVGFPQRYLSAYYGQVFAQGMYYIVENYGAVRRPFEYRYGGGSIFPLPVEGHSGSGFDYCLLAACERPQARFAACLGFVFTKIISDNNSKLSRITRPPEMPRRWCVIL